MNIEQEICKKLIDFKTELNYAGRRVIWITPCKRLSTLKTYGLTFEN